jgi:K+-transporting ATPase KdpF subunit
MKTKISKSLFLLTAIPVSSDTAVSNGPISYLIGGIVALLILGYLVYTLLRPEKF